MNKKVKESVAIVILDHKGQYLAVQRAADDSFPGMWGLPAASVREGESLEDTTRRAARDKLGVEIEIIKEIGDRTESKGDYNEHLTEFEVRVTGGELALDVRDASVSKYASMKFTDDPKLLIEAAQNGSICSRIYLAYSRIAWK